jgi:hypothetical protein
MERRGEFAPANLQAESYLEREHNARWTVLGYTGEIPLNEVRAAFSRVKDGLLEEMENEAAA